MKPVIEKNLPVAETTRGHTVRFFSPLLMVALLGPLAAAHAETWSFKLVRAPIALNSASPTSESIRLSGGGTFDPALHAVAASGTFTLFNAFDHPNGPVVNGTWHSTGFVSFTSKRSDGDDDDDDEAQGVLTISIETVDANGTTRTGEMMTLMNDGIQGTIYGSEMYIVPPGGSGGRTTFERKGRQPFYPRVP